MGNDAEDVRREALAEFVSRCRKALPAPSAGRRRTNGWRREEVAAAAGVSTTWFTWLEQGRDITMSEHALARLARVLRLDATQTRYLFDLARPRRVQIPQAAVDPELLAFVAGLMPMPAYALDRGWRVIAVNDAGGDVLSVTVGESIIEKLFLDAGWKDLFQNREAVIASSAAQYRASVGGRPEYREDVDRLMAHSEEFARHWRAGDVQGPPLWQKALRHPRLGPLALRYASLAVDSAGGVSVSIYTPVDDATRRAIGSGRTAPEGRGRGR